MHEKQKGVTNYTQTAAYGAFNVMEAVVVQNCFKAG
jgi:hypothetical protein